MLRRAVPVVAVVLGVVLLAASVGVREPVGVPFVLFGVALSNGRLWHLGRRRRVPTGAGGT